MHSAAPQAVGYLHQARFALLRALQPSQPEDASVVVEGLDDVALQSPNGATTLNQLKHHINEEAKLTDKSTELWKTIRVWCSYFASDGGEKGPLMLNLVTTAEAPGDSAAALLRQGAGRDVEEAERRLLSAAGSSTNESLEKAFDAYEELGKEGRIALLKSVTVYDEACTIEEAAEEIKRLVRLSVAKKHVEGAYNRLEGWWFDKVVRQLLDPSSTPIPRGLVLAELRSIADQFGAENLPIDFSDAHLEEEEYAGYDSRTFVQQIKDIAANMDRVKGAILDYYRAFEQRSKWVSEELIYDEDLEKYERKLIEEWQRRKAAYEDELGPDADESDMQDFGKRLLKWVELEAAIPIRPQVEEKYVVRGSYHILADERVPRVHWHPEFLERLEAVLEKDSS